METFEGSSSQTEPGAFGATDQSRIKQRLGDIGRRIKHVDLRSQIVAHPFAAVGIAAGIGAVVGLVRPMPQRGRISAAIYGAATAIGLRMLREVAITQLGGYAKQYMHDRQQRAQEGMQAQAPQAGTAGTSGAV